MVRCGVEEILGENDIVNDVCDNDATKNDDEKYVDFGDDNLNASDKEPIARVTRNAQKEKHYYDETFGKESIDLFNIVVKEDLLLGNKETSDGRNANDSEEVLEDFKQTTSKENDDLGSLGRDNDGLKGSINETDDQSNTEENKEIQRV